MDTIIVKVGMLPGKIQEVVLDQEERTVATAVEAAKLDPDGYEIRVNGEVAETDVELHNMDIVLLVKKIKGNY